MDAARFDQVVRSVAFASRRRVLRGLAGGILGTLVGLPLVEGTVAACRRPKAACGRGCCRRTSCFAKRVDGDTGQVTSVGCCPARSVCRSRTSGFPDQCCYPDEQCDPTLPRRDPAADSICCRTCPDPDFGGCCRLSQECRDGKCVELGTARLARVRG